MITKVAIRDNRRCPVGWACSVPGLENGKTYEFKPGINIIVGENGSGKSTLMEIIRRYLLVDYTQCSTGVYNSTLNKLNDKAHLDGVDVFGDYRKNTFRLCHRDEIGSLDCLNEDFGTIGTVFQQNNSSTGESVLVGINAMFRTMFSEGAKLEFDYDRFGKSGVFQDYADYVEEHRVDCEDEWTILMDEPDRNLSIDNIKEIQGILSYRKPQTQLIAIVHNPLIIYTLSKKKGINIIEMSEGYVDKVVKTVKDIIK